MSHKSHKSPLPAICPICKGGEVSQDYKPFCGARCRDVDLNRWLSGQYAIPAADESPALEVSSLEDGGFDMPEEFDPNSQFH